jgi:hypothetical protein
VVLSGFRTCSLRATCLVYRFLLDCLHTIQWGIWSYESYCADFFVSSCNFVFGPHIFCSTVLSNTLNLSSSRSVRNQVSSFICGDRSAISNTVLSAVKKFRGLHKQMSKAFTVSRSRKTVTFILFDAITWNVTCKNLFQQVKNLDYPESESRVKKNVDRRYKPLFHAPYSLMFALKTPSQWNTCPHCLHRFYDAIKSRNVCFGCRCFSVSQSWTARSAKLVSPCSYLKFLSEHKQVTCDLKSVVRFLLILNPILLLSSLITCWYNIEHNRNL